MAAIVEWGVSGNAEDANNVYGVKDDFYIRITTNTVTYFKLKYRVKVGYKFEPDPVFGVYQPTKFYEFDVDTLSGVAYVNPIKDLYDLQFGDILPLPNTEGANESVYDQVQIEVGEVFASVADDPATFRGYDTNDTMWFFGGYTSSKEINKTLSGFKAAPYAIPYTNDTYYYAESSDPFDNALVFHGFSQIQGQEAYGLGYDEFQADGTVVSTLNSVRLDSRPTIDGKRGYWYSGISPGAGTNYREWYWLYGNAGDPIAGMIQSDRVTVKSAECLPKATPTYINYINSFGAWDKMLFYNKTEESINMKYGKKILSSGIDYEASNLNTLKSVVRPNYKYYGSEKKRQIRVMSGWMTQTELNAAEEIFSSPIAIINGEPWMPTTSSYTILDVKDRLQKIEIEFEGANIEKIQG